MSSQTRNFVPSKLLYKGRIYKLAETERGKIWRKEIATRLEQCLEAAASDELSDYEKLQRFAQPYLELKPYLQLVGLL